MQSLAPYAAQFGISEETIRNIVNRTAGYEKAIPAARYQLLTEDLQSVGPNDDITPYVVKSGAQVEHNTGNAGHRTLTFQFGENNLVDFNTLRHYVRVFVNWRDKPSKRGGKKLLEVPIGIFTFILPDRAITGQQSINKALTGNIWSLQGTDLTGLIARLIFLNSYTIPAGTSIIAAIQSILSVAMLPVSQGGLGVTPAGLDMAGPAIPLSRMSFTPSTLTAPTTIQAAAGDNILTFIDQLLTAINYWPLWVDEAGVFRTSPIPRYAGENPGMTWRYATDSTSTIVPGSIQQKLSGSTPHNIIKIISNNNGSKPLSSQAFNNSPDSNVSYRNWGQISPDVIPDDKIPDQATCDLRAYVELQKSATIAETVSFTAAVNPFHQDHDYHDLEITNPSGHLVIGTGGHGWEEQRWRIDLGTFRMDHDYGKTVAL